jgi:hypothetical protein
VHSQPPSTKNLQRLNGELAQVRERLEALDGNIDSTRAYLATALDYAANAYKAYTGSGPRNRRQLNQFVFTRLIVEDDNSVTARLTVLEASGRPGRARIANKRLMFPTPRHGTRVGACTGSTS